jgi:ATP-dependent DNA ligase
VSSYWQRRQILGSLNLAGSHWCTAPSFEDGDALWAVVERDELEGVVAKPLNSRYTPGDRRAWLKVKNRAYWKYELEREAALEQRQRARRRAHLTLVPST